MVSRLINVAGRVSVRIGAAALVAFGLLMAGGVLVRLVGSALTGSAEISEMLVIVMASMSLVAATVAEAHPRVHMLIDRLRASARRRLATLVGLLAAAFWAAAAFMNGRVTIENVRLDEHTELLEIPVTPFRAVWTIALLVVTAIVLIRVFAEPPTDDNSPSH